MSRHILLIAGTHGNEQAAVYASSKAAMTYNAGNHISELKFKIFNIPALNSNTREIPEQPKPTRDLNRAFPDDGADDISMVGITASIKTLIHDWADIVIDVHNSPACDNAILVSNDAYAMPYIRFAGKHDIHYMLRESTASTIKRYAIYNGKAGFTVEMGGMGYGPLFNLVIASQTDFLHRLLTAVDSEPASSFCKLSTDTPFPPQCTMRPLHAHFRGLVRYMGAPGSYVKAGHPVFAIYDAESPSVALEEVVAPCDCMLADCETNLWATPGMEICSVQPLIPKYAAYSQLYLRIHQNE